MASAKKTDDDILEGVRPVADVRRHKTTVLYGRSGSGKTTLAADWPKPMLYLDIKDHGTDSISDVKDIDVKDIEDSDDMLEVLLWLTRNPKKYKTVVLDTMSQLQEMMVQECAERNKKKKNSKRPGEWGSMTKQDWGSVASDLKSLIIDFRDLPMEVVFIAQDKTFTFDEEEDASSAEVLTPEVGPQLMPSVVKQLNASVSTIGNTFIRVKHIKKKDEKGKIRLIEKKQYCLRLGPNPVYVTKIRSPRKNVAPDYIVDPSYQDVMDVINGDAE